MTEALVAVGAGGYGAGISISDSLRDVPDDYAMEQKDYKSYLCAYMETLVKTKKAYKLTVTSEEKDTFLKILKDNCKVLTK